MDTSKVKRIFALIGVFCLFLMAIGLFFLSQKLVSLRSSEDMAIELAHESTKEKPLDHIVYEGFLDESNIPQLKRMVDTINPTWALRGETAIKGKVHSIIVYDDGLKTMLNLTVPEDLKSFSYSSEMSGINSTCVSKETAGYTLTFSEGSRKYYCKDVE